MVGGDDPRQVNIRDFTYNRYNTKDCIVLDRSIKEAKDSLAYLKAEKLNGYKMNRPNQPLFVKEALDGFKTYMNTKATSYYKQNTKTNEYFTKYLADNLLPHVIKILENTSVDSDCRNKIEEIRLEESALLLSTQSAIQEKNVLPSNYKEQYIYIGLGSLVLLVGLYVIAKK
jgi:hypothetical protein